MTRLLRHPLLGAALLLWAGAAPAEVLQAEVGGFSVRDSATLAATPDVVYEHVLDIGSWWHPDHTYSGDPANLSLEAKVGGFFLEALPGGGVRHLEVVWLEPAKGMRLIGGLGPLQELGVDAALTITWTAAKDDGSNDDGACEVVFSYNVGGFGPGGLESWAAPVDGVLRQQLDRLKKLVETGAPE